MCWFISYLSIWFSQPLTYYGIYTCTCIWSIIIVSEIGPWSCYHASWHGICSSLLCVTPCSLVEFYGFLYLPRCHVNCCHDYLPIVIFNYYVICNFWLLIEQFIHKALFLKICDIKFLILFKIHEHTEVHHIQGDGAIAFDQISFFLTLKFMNSWICINQVNQYCIVKKQFNGVFCRHRGLCLVRIISWDIAPSCTLRLVLYLETLLPPLSYSEDRYYIVREGPRLTIYNHCTQARVL